MYKSSRAGVLLTLCCTLALLLAACGSNAGTPLSKAKAPAADQHFTYGDVATDIASFDPGQATDQPSLEALTMVFTGLVQLDDNLQVQPQLAQSYNISPDGLTYTFHLRSNLKFSDGKSLTADDVAYSIDRALSKPVADVNGVTKTYLGLIKDADQRLDGTVDTLIGDSIIVVDPNTIQLVTSVKTAYFLEALTYPTSYVVEKSVVERWQLNTWTDHLSDNGGQGGAGPFKVQSYDHNTGIVFVPNDNYYGPKPQLQRVEFKFFKDGDSAFKAYQAGQVDYVNQVPPTQLSVARAMPNNQYSHTSQLTIDYIAMNYLAKPFDNIKIRQAFALAINKDVIANSIYHGTRIPTCHIVPQGQPGYSDNLQCPQGASTKGDPEKAKTLFQQGLQEENLTLASFPQVKISYRTGSSTVDNEVTTMIQQWKDVLGVTIGTDTMDFNNLLVAENKTTCNTPENVSACMNKGLQMWVAAWGADYPDPQDWISLQFGKGAPNNQWNYGQNLSSVASSQQQLQQQMLEADKLQNLSSRMSQYNQVEQSLINDVAWMPLDQRNSSIVLKPYVQGMVFNAQTLTPPNDWGDIYVATHQA